MDGQQTFDSLKALVRPYADRFALHEDTAETYSLQEEAPGHRTQFAVVVQGRRDVKLYFYPLHVFPELRAALPKSIAGRTMKSAKSVLKFDVLSAADAKAVATLLARAWTLIEARRAIDPRRPYHRPPPAAKRVAR